LRHQAAEWITKAEKLDATAKRAEEAKAVANETDNPHDPTLYEQIGR
jgi:hypothetical protein